jgi:hypothetical protein
MDNVIKSASGLFLIIAVIFVSIVSYTAFMENAYRESLMSTYSYSCTISADSALSNVTLFIPVPAGSTGNSPVVEWFSAHRIGGIPPEWKTTLTGSNKGTYVEIKTPVISAVQNGTLKNGYAIELSMHAISSRLIDTQNPQEHGAVFYPMQDVRTVDCHNSVNGTNGTRACFSYVIPVYADYSASPDTQVTISSEMTGRNTWKIFGPAENEYRASFSVLILGDHHGWIAAKGSLETGLGSDDAPFHLP